MYRSANRRLPLFLAALSLCFGLVPVFAQQDFDHFRTLKAVGDIPADFTMSTREKIADDIASGRTNLPPAEEKRFLEGIHRAIDRMLHSGSVIYGDEVTKYVEAVAAHLLRNKPELLASLRFYTIKSNTTNAFSTDQGIVFVTTGLISQLTSEAQLAYVLGHEISHFTEKHVVESYDWRVKNRSRLDIGKLSAYSQEHEFAADRIALELYHEAGYDEKELLSVFDVLMYSYLPFDEVEFPNSYLSTDRMYIPDSYFAVKKYPIKAEEDYDDTRSSHPNIRKRKDAALKEMEKFSGWGAVVHTQGEDRFAYIRNLCRFESVRTDIVDARFGHALYSVFLLEREFPNSIYLHRMKAEAWLGLAQFKQAGELNDVLPSSSHYEGESAALFFFLKKMTEPALLTLSIRQVYDAHRRFPDDPMITGILDRLMKTAAASEHFSPSEYASKGFRESAEAALARRDSLQAAGSVAEKPEAGQSKYDKIRTKKNINAPEGFDSSKYYLYAIPDIIADSSLMKAYRDYRANVEEKERAEASYRKLTRAERTKYDKEHPKNNHIGLEKCILVNPTLSSYKKGSVDADRSEKFSEGLVDVVAEVSGLAGIDVTQLTQEDVVLNGTASFNERNALYSFLEQAANNEGREFFPIDHEELEEIEQTYGTSNLMFTYVEHAYHPNINGMLILGSFALFPTLPITLGVYLPVQMIRGHNTEINVLMLDASTGGLKLAVEERFHSRPLRHHLGAHYYKLFQELNRKP